MKTYWDYTERERAGMERADVEALLDMELMKQGVLKVVAPRLKEIRPVEMMKKKPYITVGDVVFNTIEQAQAFLDLKPMRKRYKWEAGYDNEYPELIDDGIKQVTLTDEQSILDALPILFANKAAKEENDKATEIYGKAAKEMERCLAGVWENWYECKDKAARHQRVIDTLEEYKKMTSGDEALAEGFLEKIFTPGDIRESRAWFGISTEKAPEAAQA